MEEEANSN